jgi:hypothetical protein
MAGRDGQFQPLPELHTVIMYHYRHTIPTEMHVILTGGLERYWLVVDVSEESFVSVSLDTIAPSSWTLHGHLSHG